MKKCYIPLLKENSQNVKINVLKRTYPSRTSSGRLMSVQLTSCVYGSNNERVEETQNDSEKEMTYSSTYFAKP